MKPYLIGITGGSGSGKTSFLRELISDFKNDICLISQDDYYVPIGQQRKDENGVENFDLPESIDRKQFYEHILEIKSGRAVEKMEYTFNQQSATPKKLVFHPAPIVIVEGLFVFYFEEIRKLLDLKLFIETESHIALKRRISRDQIERGYDIDDVLYRFEHHVMPAFNQYLRPLINHSDLIIPNITDYKLALSVIEGFLRNKLRQQQDQT